MHLNVYVSVMKEGRAVLQSPIVHLLHSIILGDILCTFCFLLISKSFAVFGSRLFSVVKTLRD